MLHGPSLTLPKLRPLSSRRSTARKEHHLPRLLLFGGLEVVDDARGLPVPLQPKRAAILGYLAVARPGPWHRRDELLSLFWPESDDRRARSALSKAVHYLRRATSTAAVVGQGDEELGISAATLWCDVVAFEDALARGSLEEAMKLYRGDLMEGFHLPGLPEFDHWLDTERRRLRRVASDAGWELTTGAETRGDLREAVQWARLAADRSPADEVRLRRLLELLHREGNRTEAIRTFETYRVRWREQYDIEPSEQTMALVMSIRDGTLDAGPPPPKMAGSDTKASSDADLEPTGQVPSSAQISSSAPQPRPQQVPNPTTALPAVTSRTSKLPRGWRTPAGLLGLIGVVVAAIAVVSRERTGPVGATETTVAADRGGRMVLADFEDQTGEGLGRVVTEALRVDLSGTPSVRLVDRAEIAETLARMEEGRSGPVTAALAREVAVRSGAGTVLDGMVASAGTGYILTATLRSSESARPIASFRVDAEGPDEIISSIERLSRSVREASGESLRAAREARALEEVTTASLPALKLYSEAVHVFDQENDRVRSVHLLERALAEDPDFAMAWRMLGVALQGSSERERRVDAITQAFRHRDRLQEIERLLVEGLYYGLAGDGARQVQAYLDALRLDPDEPRAANNLALLYMLSGDFERAEPLFRRVIASDGPSSGAFLNLLGIQIARGHGTGAAEVLRAWEAAYPDYEGFDTHRFRVAFIQGELDAARRLVERAATATGASAQERARALARRGQLAYWEGRLDEGRRFFTEAVQSVGAEPGAVWAARLDMYLHEALVGDTVWAAARLRDAVAGPTFAALEPSARRYPLAALILTVAGDGPGLDVLLRNWERSPLRADSSTAADLDWRAAMASAGVMEGRTEGALTAFDDAMREARCTGEPCRTLLRARFYDLVGAQDRAIAVYERVRTGGYVGWGPNIAARLWAMQRLGPAYEAVGDTARSIEAYRRFVEHWENPDDRGRLATERARRRIEVLEAARVPAGE